MRPKPRILPDLPVTFISLAGKQGTILNRPAFLEPLVGHRTATQKALEGWIFPDYAVFTPPDVPWRAK